MKISMSVIIILTILFCVLPCIWFVFVGKNNEKNIKKQLKDAIKREKMSFSVKEEWNNKFIGIDEIHNSLLSLKMNSLEPDFSRIDLMEVKNCKIIAKTREFIHDKKKVTALRLLEMELTFLTDKEPVILNFYDSDIDIHEDFELKRAEKWLALVKQNIDKVKLNKIAA